MFIWGCKVILFIILYIWIVLPRNSIIYHIPLSLLCDWKLIVYLLRRKLQRQFQHHSRIPNTLSMCGANWMIKFPVQSHTWGIVGTCGPGSNHYWALFRQSDLPKRRPQLDLFQVCLNLAWVCYLASDGYILEATTLASKKVTGARNIIPSNVNWKYNVSLPCSGLERLVGFVQSGFLNGVWSAFSH